MDTLRNCEIIPGCSVTQGTRALAYSNTTPISHWVGAAEHQGINCLPSTASLLEWRIWGKKSLQAKRYKHEHFGSQRELPKITRIKGWRQSTNRFCSKGIPLSVPRARHFFTPGQHFLCRGNDFNKLQKGGTLPSIFLSKHSSLIYPLYYCYKLIK